MARRRQARVGRRRKDKQVTLQEAVDSLYQTAVVERKATSPNRLAGLAQWCIARLAAQDLPGAAAEVVLEGGARPKSWDVAWHHDGKVRLAISLKSLLSNLAGTVPNRLDDLIGEVANLQLYSPEVVIGYIMVFDVQADTVRTRDQMTWSDFLETRLSALAGRRPPVWTFGTFEAVRFVRVDFSNGPRLLSDPADIDSMFADLAAEVRRRNPGVRGQ